MTENPFMPSPNVGAIPRYPDLVFARYMDFFGTFELWEGDGWQAESMAWKDSCYIASNLSGPMKFTIRGRDAQRFLSSLSINNVYDWPVGTSKHLVMTDENGLVAVHGLAMRDDEETFRQLAVPPWVLYKSFTSGMEVTVEPSMVFIFQVAGPQSVRVIERVLGKSLRDLEFLQVRKVQIPGIPADVEIEVSRIGMVGTLAYELRGDFEQGPAVYDAVYQAGKDIGIKRLGFRTYYVNHTEGGFPQHGATFMGSIAVDEAWLNSPFGVGTPQPWTGSVDPADKRARLRTPGEVNWLWMAKFDHDFLGRPAVEAEAANRKRKTVILRWNADDVIDVYASMLKPGDHYKYMEFPCAPQVPTGAHADLVTKDGRPVGISSHGVYSYYYREMISQCTIDLDQAQIGNAVTLHWGDFGGRIKEIRATVDRFPYLDLPSNRDFDLTTIASDV
jgi:vanillate/3-O-methylgallate O-demethylase